MSRVDPGESDGHQCEQVADLFAKHGLSIREIARELRMSRRRVREALRSADIAVPPRGTGRPRPATRYADPADLEERLRRLYCEERLTRAQIAKVLGLSEGLIRLRLAEYAIPTRTRGRSNREDRQDIDEEELRHLYWERGLGADAVAAKLGVSHTVVLRAAHERGLPVRADATDAERAPIRLIRALYRDRLVAETLNRHQVPVVVRGGPLWHRFPVPFPLTDDLLRDLYVGCGVSQAHIELLTGQPVATVRRRLLAAGVPMRTAGGRCPFLRRRKEQRDEPGPVSSTDG